MQNNRKLHHLKGFRVQVGKGPPKPNEGVDGDITLRTTASGLKLFVKYSNRWYVMGSAALGIPGGSRTEQVLSENNLRSQDSSSANRGKETFINTKTKNLEMGGNLKTTKTGFINRDGLSNKGLYFGRDDVDKPGQAYFDDDVFIQRGFKLYLSDGNLTADSDSNYSWLVASLDTVVELAVDGNVFMQWDATNNRVKSNKDIMLGTNGYMTLSDNEIDISSGDLTLDVAGDIIADVAGGQFTITDNSIGDPDLIIKGTSNDSAATSLHFKKLRNGADAGQDNDYIMGIYFTGHNDAGTPAEHLYGSITGQIIDASDGTEVGKMFLNVSTKDASYGALVATGLTLTGSNSVNDQVDVSIASGTASTTTIAGDLDIDGDTITSAGELEIDAGGDVNITGQDFSISSAKNFYLDGNTSLGGSSDTYIREHSDDLVRYYVGGDLMMSMTENGTSGNTTVFNTSSVGFTRQEATFDATSTVVDFRHSNKWRLEMTADITDVKLYFPAASGNFVLVCTTDGDHDVTNWKVFASDAGAATTTDVMWAGGSVPAFTNNGIDIVSFYWDASEEQCYGVASLAFATP